MSTLLSIDGSAHDYALHIQHSSHKVPNKAPLTKQDCGKIPGHNTSVFKMYVMSILVQIDLIGKQQKQYDDKLYYQAVRQVIIRGHELSGMDTKAYMDQQSMSEAQTSILPAPSQQSSRYNQDVFGW